MNKASLWLIGLLLILAGAAYYIGTHSVTTLGPDAQQKASMSTTLANARSVIVGTWQSTEDQKFTRQFASDGSTVDSYQGEPSATTYGSWSLFTSENPDPGFRGTLAPEVVYLKIESPYEALFYSVTDVTDTDLHLIYLDRGGHLDFLRVR